MLGAIGLLQVQRRALKAGARTLQGSEVSQQILRNVGSYSVAGVSHSLCRVNVQMHRPRMNGVEEVLVKSVIPKRDQESGWREDTMSTACFRNPLLSLTWFVILLKPGTQSVDFHRASVFPSQRGNCNTELCRHH